LTQIILIQNRTGNRKHEQPRNTTCRQFRLLSRTYRYIAAY